MGLIIWHNPRGGDDGAGAAVTNGVNKKPVAVGLSPVNCSYRCHRASDVTLSAAAYALKTVHIDKFTLYYSKI